MKRSAVVSRVMQSLLERFGEPIGDAPDAGEGVADERNDRRHRGPSVGNRGFGAQLEETRDRVTPDQVLDAWEEIYIEKGSVTLAELTSWLATHDWAVKRAWPADLKVLDDGQVIRPEDLEDVNESQMPTTCQQCGGMMGLDEQQCSACGSMPASMDEAEQARHPGHAAGCTCPDCSRPEAQDEVTSYLDEVTPPGREKQVKALKKQPGVKNPWAVAWSSYDKSRKK